MRVALARLLLAAPDLLLLDEPTNHLDLEAIDWLERFLDGWDGAFIVVSHDRYFLNRMVRGIVELDRGSLTEFPGGYDDYLVEREARIDAQEEAAKHQAKEIARVDALRRALPLQEHEGATGSVAREGARQDRADRRAEPGEARAVRILARAALRRRRRARRGRAEGLRARPASSRDLGLLLRRGDRVALVGPNGAGKSTLLKLLSGV